MSSKPQQLPALPGAVDASAATKSRKPLRERSPVLAHLRSVFFAGLLTAVPLFLTIYILNFVYALVTQYTKTPASWLVSRLFPGNNSELLHNWITATAAVVISLLVVYILGLLGSFFIGRQILAQVEHFIENLPLIKGIYGTTKQVMAVFRQSGGGGGFQRVVLVEFPRKGTWTIAFVTNTVNDAGAARGEGQSANGGGTGEGGGKMVCCFIPMTPNPTSGFFQMFPEDDVRNTDWSVDMGIKIVLSGGLLAPKELTEPHAK